MNKIIAEVFLVVGTTCAGLLIGLELLEMDTAKSLSFARVAGAIGLFCIGSFLFYLFSRNKER